ncbi:MAG: succinate dehydrogenase assembly factor 2 [Alphaproteobacteria bacterium]
MSSSAGKTASETRRHRLQFRSWHRGTKELDLILGPFADATLTRMSDAELDQYEALLTEPDPDVYDWVAGRAPVPAQRDSEVVQMLLAFHRRSKDHGT